VLLLNSGILHRVGACRMHVQIARALAAQGFTTLRFDHAGIGDSEGRKDTLPFEQAAVQETREAMDYLEQSKGAREFLLGGLCSGADMAHMVAAVDVRVKGLFMLDPWAYRTRGYYLRHYGLRALQPAVWKTFIRHRVGKLRGAVAPSSATALEEDFEVPTYVREFPPREKVASELRRFVERNMRIVAIFSGGQQDCYNHEGQYAEAFAEVPFGGRLRECYYATADHIFTGMAHQRAIVEAAQVWAMQYAPAGDTSADAVPPAPRTAPTDRPVVSATAGR
jgi:hypothetical protein